MFIYPLYVFFYYIKRIISLTNFSPLLWGGEDCFCGRGGALFFNYLFKQSKVCRFQFLFGYSEAGFTDMECHRAMH